MERTARAADQHVQIVGAWFDAAGSCRDRHRRLSPGENFSRRSDAGDLKTVRVRSSHLRGVRRTTRNWPGAVFFVRFVANARYLLLGRARIA
jgi:hypothetical protein